MSNRLSVQQVHDMWSQDNLIDKTQISNEAINIAVLHNKYYLLYAQALREVNELKSTYNKVINTKTQYYKGELNNKEDLEKYGWEPQRKKILKQDITSYLDSDEDIIALKSIIDNQVIVKDYLNDIVQNINRRGFQIRAIIDWEKFIHGEN